jgi:hypothetical protein
MFVTSSATKRYRLLEFHSFKALDLERLANDTSSNTQIAGGN